MLKTSLEELKKVLRDFYNLTKFKIVICDSDRNFLYSYPEKMCKFCEIVKTNPYLAEKCAECDNIGFDICDKTRRPYIYECHMSATEAIAPIYFNGINMGYLMFGQILQTDSRKIKEAAKCAFDTFGLPLIEDMISEMRIADESYINSAVNMMTMCANYLYTSEIIRDNPDVLAYRLKEYILSHLNSDLTVKSLCKHFYISKTKLYKISKKNFKTGISDYIRSQRIKKAKTLIASTENSISQIASAVGIWDTNYFIRIFKQSEGITPLQYRKRL